MQIIKWNDDEMEIIKRQGEVCQAVAKAAMVRSGINFDQIEHINEHYETHNWGSNTDRKYRKSAVNKAIAKVAANPLQYAAQ
jgi:chaperone required for assembly of F1-ATPase